MTKKILLWLMWCVIGSLGLVLFLKAVDDSSEASFWRAFDISLGLVVMVSAYDQLGLLWWRKRSCCDRKEHLDERS